MDTRRNTSRSTRSKTNWNTKTPNRRAQMGLRAILAVTLISIPSAAFGADDAKSVPRTPLKNPQTISVRAQLKGWGFENTAGFRADMTGSVGPVGLVMARLEEDATSSVVLGIQDGKLRVRSKARYTFTAPNGTFYGDSPSELSIPVVLTAAGPAPDPSRFVDAVVTIDVLGGTGRYQNAAGTVSLRGIIAEIPSESGRKRFAIELSGTGTLIVERDTAP